MRSVAHRNGRGWQRPRSGFFGIRTQDAERVLPNGAHLKRLAVLSLVEELNAMGDCAFSEWCRRSKASGAAVPGSVCAVCPQTTASTSLDNQESGRRPNCPGSPCTATYGRVVSIRHCDVIRSVQRTGNGGNDGRTQGRRLLCAGFDPAPCNALQMLSRRRPASSMCGGYATAGGSELMWNASHASRIARKAFRRRSPNCR